MLARVKKKFQEFKINNFLFLMHRKCLSWIFSTSQCYFTVNIN